jgi:hypothetical protein
MRGKEVQELAGLNVRVAFCLEWSAKNAGRRKDWRTVTMSPLPACENDQYLLVAKVRKVA